MIGMKERLRGIASWSTDDPQYLSLVDQNCVLMECLLDQEKKDKNTPQVMGRSACTKQDDNHLCEAHHLAGHVGQAWQGVG